MANFSIFTKRLGLKKEAVRGTVETTPDVWVAVSPDSEFKYDLQLIADESVRGVMSKYPSAPGIKSGTGLVKMPLRSQNVGEFFRMLIGAPTTAQQGATTAYKHTFTPGNTLALPSYTFFFDRGMNVLKYNLGSVSKIKLASEPDGFVMMESEVMFKTEASGSIGSPSYSESEELGFQHVTIKIDGSSNTEVKSWEVEMANGLFPKRTFSQSQDVVDLLATENMASGSFIIYFANATERDKFIAGTSSSLQMLIEGDTIESTFKHTVDLFFDKVMYKAFPYGEQDGLLAAQVEWEAHYDTVDSRIYKVDITNTKTAY